MEYAATRNIYEKCKNSGIRSSYVVKTYSGVKLTAIDDAAEALSEPGTAATGKTAARASSTHTRLVCTSNARLCLVRRKIFVQKTRSSHLVSSSSSSFE